MTVFILSARYSEMFMVLWHQTVSGIATSYTYCIESAELELDFSLHPLSNF